MKPMLLYLLVLLGTQPLWAAEPGDASRGAKTSSPAFEAPPEPPPAAPFIENYLYAFSDHGTINVPQGMALYLFSGEFHCRKADLHIRGRGLDFVWARRYRSRVGPDTAMGNGWDYSYNIRVKRKAGQVIVYDGWSRRDIFQEQPDGTYGADQFFREGRFDRGFTFRLAFADGGTWEFLPLDDSPAQGRIARIADRNGNALRFEYDELGRLARILDTLDRAVSVAYNPDGFIESVTDFIGRQVRYEYYQDGDAAGSFGDLKSVTSPAVTGTPNGNDFAGGKATRYTYSKGSRRAALNRNLLTVTDAKGQTWLRNVYASTTDPNDLNFDRVQFQTVGHGGDTFAFAYALLTPGADNGHAVAKTILNDRMGNVSEYFYDAENRCVRLRKLTGRAVPGETTTDTANRPTGKLRPDDPDYFETRWEWNVDSLPTRVELPNGTAAANTFESALDPAAPRRHRGNLRERRILPGPLGGDPPVLMRTFTHDLRFGTPEGSWYQWYEEFVINGNCGSDKELEGAFVLRAVDARGNETGHTYDARGNRTQVLHREPGTVEDFEYNEAGQLTARILPDNGRGQRTRVTLSYHPTGAMRGYLHQRIVDAGPTGLNLVTTYEYDAVGNAVRVIDPRGHDALYTYNQLDQIVQAESRPVIVVRDTAVRYTTDIFHDTNDNVVRVCRSNQDENGALSPNNAHLTTLCEYDILNRPVRVWRESGRFDVPRSPPQLDGAGLPGAEFAVTEYAYDANGNRVLTQYPEAVAGRDPFNLVRFVYDERNLPFRRTDAFGHADQSTTQWDYDGNGNLMRVTQGLEGEPRVMRWAFDGFNRPTRATDPMGNVAHQSYDANGNPISSRHLGELNDAPGSAGNLRLAETSFLYDAMDRLIRSDAHFFDPAAQAPFDDGLATARWTYNGLSQILTETDDRGHATHFQYNPAHRLELATDPRGNSLVFTYDENGNLRSLTSREKSDLGHSDEHFTTAFEYDALDRRVAVVDNVGNASQSQYNSRHNLVRQVDPLGIETRFEYDGLNRRTAAIRDMNGDGARSDDGEDIVVRDDWDSSSRLVRQVDDNGHATEYAYDSLGRLVSVLHADGTTLWHSYDTHGNLVSALDPNGTAILRSHDLLNRLRRTELRPGTGVATDTTLSAFDYDGLSRLTQAGDEDSVVVFAYDSLGNQLQEIQNGLAVTATYDATGNRLTAVYPGGRSFTYQYDALNRLAGVSDAAGDIAAFAFVGARVEQRRLGNATESLYSYDGISGIPNPAGDFGVKQPVDAVHLIHGQDGGVLLSRDEFTWDPAQNLGARLSARPLGAELLVQHNEVDLDFTHRLVRSSLVDSLGGLTRETTYELDGVGNRIRVTENGLTGTYLMDGSAPEPLDWQMNQYTATPFDLRRYDANGNPTSLAGAHGQRELSYDAADRLVRHTEATSGVETTFAYDALGRRIGKTFRNGAGESETTRFLWSGWRLIEEQDEAGHTVATYVHGPTMDDIVQMQRLGSSFFYHHDGRGNVAALTDAGGHGVESYEYGDFGEPQVLDGAGVARAGSVAGNPYLFGGRRFDEETGLYHFRARYYEPETGRFLTRNLYGAWFDPVNLGNGYTYVGNNPQTWQDPTGLPTVLCPTCSIKPARFTVPPAAHGRLDQLLRVAGAAAEPLISAIQVPVTLRVIFGSAGGPYPATHEVGHWIGLDHQFGDTADYVIWRSSLGPLNGNHFHPDFLWPPTPVSTAADVEGYPEIAGLFRDTAEGETGSASIDGAILVVSAQDGPMPVGQIPSLLAGSRNVVLRPRRTWFSGTTPALAWRMTWSYANGGITHTDSWQDGY